MFGGRGTHMTVEAMGRRYRVVLIPGDGIGPEVTDAALTVLHAAAASAGFTLAVERHEAGAGAFRRSGRVMSDETFAACRDADGVLKGPVELPEVRLPDGTEAGLLGGVLRGGLDLFANLRPIRLLDGVPCALADRAPGSIDYAIVQEEHRGAVYLARQRRGHTRCRRGRAPDHAARHGTRRPLRFRTCGGGQRRATRRRPPRHLRR